MFCIYNPRMNPTLTLKLLSIKMSNHMNESNEEEFDMNLNNLESSLGVINNQAKLINGEIVEQNDLITNFDFTIDNLKYKISKGYDKMKKLSSDTNS